MRAGVMAPVCRETAAARRASYAKISQRFHTLRFGPCTRPLAARRSRMISLEYARHDIHAAASLRLTK